MNLYFKLRSMDSDSQKRQKRIFNNNANYIHGSSKSHLNNYIIYASQTFILNSYDNSVKLKFNKMNELYNISYCIFIHF